MYKDKIDKYQNAPIRDWIAIQLYKAARYAYNFFSYFTIISPNCSSAIVSMEIDTVKVGIRFKSRRELNGISVPNGSFLMRREDLIRGIEALDKALEVKK